MNTIQRVASLHMEKQAASGMFGFTKSVQRDVESAIRKLQKKTEALSRPLENRHQEAGSYLTLRGNVSKCPAAKALSGQCLLNKAPTRVLKGPMGYKPSCVKACHKSISDLILYAGEVAHSLHNRDRDHIPFLKMYVKRRRCPFAKILLENHPPVVDKELL